MSSPLSPHGSPAQQHNEDSCLGALPQENQFKNAISKELFGKKMTVVTWNHNQYLIGVQIAHYLKRETFNLYRSMKLANIDIVKCQPTEIEELTQLDAIKRGIHSVTLVPYEQGVSYIGKELRRKPRKKCEKRARKETDIVLNTSFAPASPPSSESLVSSSDGQGSAAEMEESSGTDDSVAPADISSPVGLDAKRLHWQRLLQFALAEHSRLTTMSA